MDESTTDTLPGVGAPPLIGRTLDSRYEMFDDIGSGYMAHVFRAWDHQLQHVIAVKILDGRFHGDADLLEAFEREARLTAGLPTHRNIVQVHDVGRDEGLPYLAMELVTGESLKDLIAAEGPLPAERAFEICQQAAAGLEFAHQYGLIHGNVRPQNILISRSGQVKLTDFGLGSLVGGTTAGRGPLMVRAQYLSPEQALGGEAEPRSDIYALGVVLFEMLTGALPFRAANPAALATKHAREAAPDPRTINRQLSPTATRIVLRALEKDPAKRYRSAAALAAALHESQLLEKGETARMLAVEDTSASAPPPRPEPSTPPPTAPSPTPKAVPVGRPPVAPPRPRWVTLTSLVFVAAILVAAAGGWLAYRAVARAIQGWGASPTTVHRSPAGQHRPAHAAVSAHPRAAGRAQQAAPAPGCGVGPVRFLHMWAETVQIRAGGSITFDYTIANNSQQCRRVFLGLKAISDTQPGAVLKDPAGARMVQALPGVHMYRRTFTFPPTAAGQRFDVLLSLRSPSHLQLYGAIRVNRLIAVTP